MKTYYCIALLFLLSIGFTSCEDYFDTNPNTILKDEKFIREEEETFKGFLSIITKMQAAGDHAIFLTDTRGDYLEATGNAPLELQQIYRYEATNGNQYADPACYYAIIDACNDFIAKMKDYMERKGNVMTDESHQNFNRLVSYTLRIKVWTYMTIGKIYGKALWFDEPLWKIEDLGNTDIFTLCDMQGIVTRGLSLLDEGISIYKDEVIPANEYATMSMTSEFGNTVTYGMLINWAGWINPEDPTTTSYDYMNYIVPPWLLLRCDLLSWRGTTDDYAEIRDRILTFIYRMQRGEVPYIGGNYVPVVTGDEGGYYFAVSHRLRSNYYNIFTADRYGRGSNGSVQQNIAGIMYDYSNRQTNRIVEYFASEGPGQYYLRPSAYGMSKYLPSDMRSVKQNRIAGVIKNDTCFTKYYYSGSRYTKTNIVEIQPAIPIYRGQDYHYLLIEADNNLGYWQQPALLLNNGVPSFATDNQVPAGWDPRYYIFLETTFGGYANLGLVQALRGKYHELPQPTGEEGKYLWKGEEITERAKQKIYDLALLDEYLLEYTGEGRSYAMMVRMAEKWDDPAIIADRVCPKYPAGEQARIRSAIMGGGYWVDWDLKIPEAPASSEE